MSLASLPGSPGADLYNRSSVVTVGPTQIKNIGQQRGLDVEFDIRRSLKPGEPNTCDLKIMNLSESSRKAIASSATPTKAIAAAPGSTAKVISVRVEAGYVGSSAAIFSGELRSAESVSEGPNIVTELSTGDGDQALALQRLSQSFGLGTTGSQVVQALLTAMGIGLGNLAAASATLLTSPLFQQGVTIKGNAADRMKQICASVGLEFSIQGGQAQFLQLGLPLAGTAFLLTPKTGLLGSPTVDSMGVLQCETELIAALAPGTPILVQSAYVQGLFRITSIRTVGATAGNEWGHRIEGKSFGRAP